MKRVGIVVLLFPAVFAAHVDALVVGLDIVHYLSQLGRTANGFALMPCPAEAALENLVGRAVQ